MSSSPARDKMNAMDKEMFAAIGDAFRALGRDPQVRAILLSGQGKHFTAGLDLEYAGSQFGKTQDPGRAAEARLRHIEWLQERVQRPGSGARAGGRGDSRRLRRRRRRSRQRVPTCGSRRATPSSRSPRSMSRSPRTSARCSASATSSRRACCVSSPSPAAAMGAEEAAGYGLVNQLADDRDGALAAGMALARTIAAKSPARGGGRQAEPQSQPRPPGRGGAARRRRVERRDFGQRGPHRSDPRGSARPSRASVRSRMSAPAVLPAPQGVSGARGAVRFHHDQAVAL